MNSREIDSSICGSGLLFFWQDKILLLLRSPLVHQPLSWGLPGGMLRITDMANNQATDEIKLKSAIRERQEELGAVPSFGIFDQITYKSGPFQYTTFLCHLPPDTIWNIRLNWEHLQYCWFSKNKLPPNLHPGVKYIIRMMPQYFYDPDSCHRI
jgi:hypothetical protein